MRELDIGTTKYTKTLALDKPGHGGASHKYSVVSADTDDIWCEVNFQKGPVRENGVNGCHNEDLLAIVLDRLESFQAGSYACSENDGAIQSIKLALKCLRTRTNDRTERGVEGTATL